MSPFSGIAFLYGWKVDAGSGSLIDLPVPLHRLALEDRPARLSRLKEERESKKSHTILKTPEIGPAHREYNLGLENEWS